MSVQIQFARLFGAESTGARKTQRTATEWKVALQKILRELDRYIQANVDTDELHSFIITSGLFAAGESLKKDDFWPGYAEGITRALLALVGDYPDHRRRRGGSNANGHYLLNLHRSLHYAQDTEQRFRTLLAAGVFGVPGLSAPPLDVLNDFRRQFGAKPTHAQFVRWDKKHFPADYTAVFS